MKQQDLNKIIDYIKSQNITGIGDEVYDFRKRNQDEKNYIIVNAEGVQFGPTENLDLLTIQIYSQEIKGPGYVKELAEQILELIRGEEKDFNGFTPFRVLPTGDVKDFSLKGQFKVTLFFQVSYLV